MIVRLISFVCLWACSGFAALAQEPVVPEQYRSLVPQRLLPLIHASEVQQELKLSEQQIIALETCLQRLDGPWFRSRVMTPEKQTPELDRLEAEFWKWAPSVLTASQIERLKQIERQSLGSRMFFRKDVAGQLNLTAAQTQKLAESAQTTVQKFAKLQEATLKSLPTTELEKAANKAYQTELRTYRSIITENQWKQLAKMVGPAFETSQLKRIYPMAPEFADDSQWINSDPLTLQSLRDQVVIVHFYAFQCHNCHANFEIYRRWHEKWQNKGVVVIGIQSPETRQERELEAVQQAATERKLLFPIIMDAQMKNWNAWANTMWPTVYVIDKRGYLRQWWQGELNWQGATGDKVIEQIVEDALAEPDSPR